MKLLFGKIASQGQCHRNPPITETDQTEFRSQLTLQKHTSCIEYTLSEPALILIFKSDQGIISPNTIEAMLCPKVMRFKKMIFVKRNLSIPAIPKPALVAFVRLIRLNSLLFGKVQLTGSEIDGTCLFLISRM